MFVDTQALRKARFDWNGRTLSKLAEFAKAGHLRLLVTDITIGEVKSQLRELLAEASSSVTKHSGILEQLGAWSAIENLKDQTAALASLEAAFDAFLKRTSAVNVPLISDVKSVLDDYFARRPPFSTKKKAEFPDAISVASIRSWCQQRNATAYVVSDDPDLRGCCSDSGPLYHSETIAEIISQATVSKELHDALEEALSKSDYLSDRVADEIKASDVEYSRYNRGDRANIVAARITDVHSASVVSLNILDQDGQTFTCEPEIEVEVSLDIEVEVEGSYYGLDEYEPSSVHSISQTRTELVYPEVIVRFDQSSGLLEFESISMVGQKVRVSIDEISWRSFR
ncbi:PIN domain-containing protein [Bradyrhizobium sp. Gha]|uniref:PIN domain-containing protein n=1 Tax=Bradyrhizobium sp. Gha TaxID=1855318 RepID=UPI0008E9B486|nr:PIN domain-containing protein [Bradyrhizobium sp. Gha]SFH97156.1 hypothetical protein SAMN05216525_103135 [Bradyrhizobium sp. Gha]